MDLEKMRWAVAEMVGEAPSAVGDSDDLLGLGVDSIQVMRLAGRWRRAGVDVSYAELIEHRTLAGWWSVVSTKGSVGAEPPSSTVDESAPFELAPMQHAYWVGRSDGQALGGVGAQFYCEFDGRGVDPVRLDDAVRRVLRRHGMLRARFLDDGRQEILTESPWPGVTVHDLRADTPADAERHADRTRHRLAQRRLAAEDGHVLDVHLTLFPDGGTRLHLAVEMLVCDAQSFQVLLSDLAAHYGFAGHTPLPLDFSFPRYLAGRAARRATRWAEDQAYWRARIPDLPGPPQLPVTTDPPGVAQRRHVRRCHTIPAADRARLVGHARAHSVLLSMALLTAYAEVVAAWSETPRFLLNLPFYDRDDVHPDVSQIIGDFTNVLPLAVDASAPMPFVERVRVVQQRFHADLAHAAYPGVEVLRDLARVGGATGPIAPVVFTTAMNLGELFDSAFRERFGQPGYTMSTTPQVWLDCQVTERSGDLFVNWDAVEGLFPPGVLDEMFAAYVTLVDRLVAGDWTRPVGCLASASALRVRAVFNNHRGYEPPPAHLTEDFFTHARATPAHVALYTDTGEWTYGALADRALRVAAALVGRGVTPGDAVAVRVHSGPERVAALLGVLAAGAVAVPIGVEQPAARRDRILASAGVHCVLSDVDITAADLVEPLAGPTAGEAAYVIYTSGSTGEPKGVEVSHAAALNTLRAIRERFGIGPADRVLALSAPDFDLSVFDVFGLLGAGGGVVLVPGEDRREAAVWVDLVRRFGVTIWNSVPALLDMALVAGEASPGWAEHLRVVLVSGDWVGLDQPGRLRAAAPAARFVALGGATEASIWSNAVEVTEVPADWRSIPYGHPLPGQSFRVVDAQGRDCPDWVAGELWIGGLGVARGYRNDPTRTADQFVTVDSGRWYRTGDTARFRPDGTVEFLGRRDQQVKVGGHRIELGEIEAALLTAPGVTQAVAVRLRSPRGRGRLAAVVTGVAALDPAALAAHCRSLLPAYMVPERIEVAAAIPLTGNGKVDRAAVASSLRGGRVVVPEPPVGPVETALAEVWRDVLNTPRVERTDSFFALGGDSLLATRLLGRLRDAGLVGGRLRTLLTNPVLRDFAATLTLQTEPVTRPVVVADPEHRYDPFPPTEVQRAYWVGRTNRFALGGVGSHWYWELDGVGVDVDRLADAWRRLVERHDMLRAVFDDDGNQRVLATVPPPEIGVTEADPDGLRTELAHRVADPGRWPLIEIRAVRYGDRVRLGFSFDYLVLDALSIVLVFTELATLYRDPAAELPPVGLTFRDYVLTGGPDEAEVAAARAFWAGRADTLPPAPRLPLAVDPAGLVGPRFTRREASLAPDDWESLVDGARVRGLTPSTVLAAAYARVLSDWSARADLTLNLTLFDRRGVHPDVDAVLGDFTSLLLAAWRPVAGEPFAAAATRLQAEIWAGMEHRALSAIRVLRERARRTGDRDAAMPVVFTSALGLPAELVDLDLPFGQPVWGLSQTPQVWLDCQVTVRGGRLVVMWDAVAELFPAGVLDGMFAGFQTILARLVDGAWDDPVPAGPVVRSAPGFVPVARPAPQPPDGVTETRLAGLWSTLLEVDRVDRTDNFFTLGGDSLLATRLVTALRRELGAVVTLRALLAAPTLAELATLVEASASDVDEGVV